MRLVGPEPLLGSERLVGKRTAEAMTLAELEQRLREEHKWPLYLTQVAAERAVTDAEKASIAQRVLNAPLPVALGLLLQSRKSPSDYQGE
jgi:hypothetical protein